MLWGAAIVVANVVVLAGAIQMTRLRSFGLARTAAILAIIPCIGPCYLLGIPFGIWALVVLHDPAIRHSFR